MAIASITAWLENPNRSFVHGKMLYEQYGNDPLTLTLIRTGSSPFHFAKLQAALEALNKRADLEVKPIFIPEQPQALPMPRANSKQKVDLTEAPDQIREIRNLKNEKYAQARDLYARIRFSDDQNYRLQAALVLLNNMDLVQESWEALDEWGKTGRIRELKAKEIIQAVDDLTIQQLIQQQKNLASYISKDRKKSTATDDPKKKTKILGRIQENLLRQEQIANRINQLQ